MKKLFKDIFKDKKSSTSFLTIVIAISWVIYMTISFLMTVGYEPTPKEYIEPYTFRDVFIPIIFLWMSVGMGILLNQSLRVFKIWKKNRKIKLTEELNGFGEK